MTPINLPYLNVRRHTKRGRTYVYAVYRRAGQVRPIEDEAGKRLLPDDPGFVAAYQRVHARFETGDTGLPRSDPIKRASSWDDVIDAMDVPPRKDDPLQEAPCHVYFVKSADLVKIGVSKDVWHRIAGLRAQCPVGLDVLLVIAASRWMESYMHEVFAEYGCGGEWFRHEGRLSDFLRNFTPGTFVSERDALNVVGAPAWYRS